MAQASSIQPAIHSWDACGQHPSALASYTMSETHCTPAGMLKKDKEGQPKIRRKSVTSEPYCTMTTKLDRLDLKHFQGKAFHSKTKYQEGIVRCATFDSFIFSRLNLQQFQWLLQAIKSNVQIPAGSVIAHQGSYANKFFIVESGTVEEQINNAIESHLQIGAGFGELSLLHDVQWSASYVAATDVVLMELSRSAYQAIMIEQSIVARQIHKQLIDHISLFKKLKIVDRYRIVDALSLVEYQDGQVLYRRNELTDKKIFIIKNGNAVGFYDKEKRYRTITKIMGEGDYFGNSELLKGQQDIITTTTTIIAYGSLTCLTLKEDTLYRLVDKKHILYEKITESHPSNYP